MNYRVPIPYPAEVIVELFADRVGNSSVTIGHTIASADGATVYADGHVVMVWIDRARGRPTPLPEVVRRAAPASGRQLPAQIGRAPWRERGCQYVSNSGGAGFFKK